MSHLARGPIDENEFQTFKDIRAAFGFLPNFFRAQTLRPDLIDAEVGLIGTIMMKDGALSRKQKEYIFLVCSAADLSTYCVTAHCEIVRMLGIDGPEPEQIAVDHNHADIDVADKALLNFALKLNNTPKKIVADDLEDLRAYGFSDTQILETIVMTSVSKFSNLISFGLGTVPDFDSTRVAGVLASK